MAATAISTIPALARNIQAPQGAQAVHIGDAGSVLADADGGLLDERGDGSGMSPKATPVIVLPP